MHVYTWTIWSLVLLKQCNIKVEKRIHFELFPTSMSRDELGKLSGQRGQGRVKSTGKTDLHVCLIEVKLPLLKPRRNLTSLELYSQQPRLLVL